MRVVIAAIVSLLAAQGSTLAAERPENWAYQVLMGGLGGVVMRGEYWDPRIPVALRARGIEARWPFLDEYFSSCQENTLPTPRYWLGVAVLVRSKDDPLLGQGRARFVELAQAAGDTVLAVPRTDGGAPTRFFVFQAGVPPEGIILIIKCMLNGRAGGPGEEAMVRYAATVLAGRR